MYISYMMITSYVPVFFRPMMTKEKHDQILEPLREDACHVERQRGSFDEGH